MNYAEFSAAAQLLAEERVGQAMREIEAEEDAVMANTRRALRVH